jgi:hypothetical protein
VPTGWNDECHFSGLSDDTSKLFSTVDPHLFRFEQDAFALASVV